MKKNCKICKKKKLIKILDLGNQPPANALHNNKSGQKKFPLIFIFCKNCKTLQLSHAINPKDLFRNYLWVTKTSKTANLHAKIFYKKVSKLINSKSNILEIASNDGTFLREFKKKNHDVLGVDPAKNLAKIANQTGIKTIPHFFSDTLVRTKLNKSKYNLIFARNVIPHVKNIHSVVKGISKLSDKNTKIVIEFHYLRDIFRDLQYDSIYHEHLFYFSIYTISNLFIKYGLYPNDYFDSPISGGSVVLIFSKTKKKKSKKLKDLEKKEKSTGINNLNKWLSFAEKAKKHKIQYLKILKKKYSNQKIFGYGASARSSTFINYLKLNFEDIEFIIDNNKLKHNLYTPGSNIKILSLKNGLKKIKNKSLVILAWNFKKEILNSLKNHRMKINKIIVPFSKK